MPRYLPRVPRSYQVAVDGSLADHALGDHVHHVYSAHIAGVQTAMPIICQSHHHRSRAFRLDLGHVDLPEPRYHNSYNMLGIGNNKDYVKKQTDRNQERI